jgi:CubicO group peptidase (beta-lactamase class C family)
MKSNYILVILLVLLTSFKSVQADTSTLSSSDLESLRQYMKSSITKNHLSGAVLGIASADQTIFLEAFGKSDVDKNTAMTTDTLFHIGSTNKAITSFLIGILVDEGVLQWDQKAIDIYPDFILSNQSYAEQITIRQLLDMSSGLSEDGNINSTILEKKSARFILEGLSNAPALLAAGEQYTYSNLSVSMAAYLAVLAKAKADNGVITESDLDNLHAGYERLLREKVLVPLGMNDAYLYIDDARATGKMASAHHLENNAFVVSTSEDQNVDVFAPAGGLKTSANSLLRYIMTEMQSGLSPEGTRILSASNTTERQKLSAGISSENEYGLCLEIKTLSDGLNYIGHNGSFDDFNSVMGFFPDKQIGFVLLMNTESTQALKLSSAKGIENKIAELLNKGIISTPNEADVQQTNYFQLKINRALDTDVSVHYETRNGSAIAGQDYNSTTGTATIIAGQTQALITVDILADTLAEEDENFSVVLSNPVGASFASGITELITTHTIIDDD